MEWEKLRTDVLVIGGGGAGSRAALEASAQGAEVTLVNKMVYGISGATAFRAAVIGQYQAVGKNRTEGDSADVHADDILHAGQGMADEKLVRILVKEAPQRIDDLERWGVEFERRDGRYHIIKGCFASIPRSHVLKDHGYLIVQGLERAVRADDRIQVLENTMITNLIVQDGRCTGAIAVNRQNQWFVIEAGATIMAAGGASRTFQDSMYPNDITGDSYSLGFQAGAIVTNMEFVQLGLVTVHPRGGAVNTWTWRMNPRIYNEKREPFLPSYLPSGVTSEDAMALKANHWPFTTRDASSAIEISIQDQIQQRQHGPNGGIYVDFTHVGEKEFAALPDAFKPVWTMMVENFHKRGIDLSREPLEAVVGSHSVNGGFYIDETTATTLPGLYACGECAAGMHGADRLGGNNLPAGQVFGRRAGMFAAQYAQSHGAAAVPDELAQELVQAWASKQTSESGRATVSELAHRLRMEVSHALCTNRSEVGMTALLDRLQGLKEQLDRGVYSRKGFMPICELAHMLQAAELIATAARERRESRGPHHRKDYPLLDEQQSSQIVMRQGNDGTVRVARAFIADRASVLQSI